jgi:hypothetical protein
LAYERGETYLYKFWVIESRALRNKLGGIKMVMEETTP